MVFETTMEEERGEIGFSNERGTLLPIYPSRISHVIIITFKKGRLSTKKTVSQLFKQYKDHHVKIYIYKEIQAHLLKK